MTTHPPVVVGPGVTLSVTGLSVAFDTPGGDVRVASDISFTVSQGEAVAIVGESGSGKSVTALSILGLLPASAHIVGGSVAFEGRELLGSPESELRSMRGRDIAMIFQDPSSSLNPVFSVGWQLDEALRLHGADHDRRGRARRIADLLASVGIADPATRATQYPHQYSGGMRQRAMFAMALANHPRLLIADEPTTALDVTIQAQILELLGRLRRDTGCALLLITHDLGVVTEVCDRVLVMYAGRIVEQGPVRDLFSAPRHPYTRGLLRSRPTIDSDDALLPIPGQPPDMAMRPSGCAFHPRCDLSRGREPCRTSDPPLREVAPSRWSACHFAEEMAARAASGEAGS
jgi:oligopeptide/dipeptide ABC transporter ATP-binding protein